MISRRTLMALFGGAVVAPLAAKVLPALGPIFLGIDPATPGADLTGAVRYADGELLDSWTVTPWDLPYLNCRCVLLPGLGIFE